ncbi:MAG: M81 family metallopeptidase, partial [Planctomycetaceae bacterium]
MRVGIVALLHESNTFISEPTTLEHFRQNLLLRGEAIREALAGSHHETGGFFAGLDEADIEAVPVFAARALPFGTVTAETFERLQEMLFAALAEAGPLDGILAAPHGATVSEAEPDADGAWLERLRETVGPSVPIVATCDPHANLSPRMVAATDAIIAYRSNPHLDQRDRGIEAARLMAQTLRGEVRPVQRAVFPPMAIGIERQATDEEPCRTLAAHAEAIRRRPDVLACSLVLGFPYADVPEMGSAVNVVTDGDPALAEQLANELAAEMWRSRHDLIGRFVSIEEAIAQAASLAGPVCLLDMGDNVGGGSPGDGTLLGHALHRRRVGPAFVCLCDPKAVRQAVAAGVGTRVTLSIGGKTDALHGPPLQAEFSVISLHDGRFEEPEARHGGMTKFDQGRTAVVRSELGLSVMLSSRRMTPFSLNQLTSCGLDPKHFHVLVAKGVNAPIAAYAPVCKHLIRVNTPGVTAADMTALEYRHRRRPMFPFEPETLWDAAQNPSRAVPARFGATRPGSVPRYLPGVPLPPYS